MNDLGEIISTLPSITKFHNPQCPLYRILEKFSRQEAEKMFSLLQEKKSLGPIGEFFFPFFKMGAVDSIDLFGLDELILFSFYWVNRNRYHKVIDIGANIGLHSTIMAKCGYQVKLFEPDPTHFKKLKEILETNQLKNIETIQGAVSNYSGKAEFIRVLGNTTSSHLAGCKEPYGNLEKFEVSVFDIQKLIQDADLIKMDVEGNEDKIILATSHGDWNDTDAVLEVGSKEKAQSIFHHLKTIQAHAFSQKTNWQQVTNLDEMPFSYKEGSLFISKKEAMPWIELK